MSALRRYPLLPLILAGCLAGPRSLWACAACFGASDSSMARGMNFGILTLLIVVLATLGGLAAFFIYLARRAAAVARNTAPPANSQPANS